jgi:NADH-quinone oxidoreductase subunit N
MIEIQTISQLLEYTELPEIFLALSSLILIILGVKNGNKITAKITIISIIILAVSFMLLLAVSDQHIKYLDSFYRDDSFSKLVKIIIILSAIVTLILYLGHLDYNLVNSKFEFPILIIFAVIGMMIMVSAKDFLTLYMGLELQSLAIYILVSINSNNLKSSESGIKYFILGALSTAILLYGVSLVYGFTGSINFLDVAAIVSENDRNIGIIIALVFIFIALAFKVSAVPFHMWTPDVYEGAPTPITLFLATAPKAAAFIAMFRVLGEAFPGLYEDWQSLINIIAIASLFIGALGAIMQQNFKRLLAYSSINHVGFILLTISVFSSEAIEAMLFYIIIYITLIFAAFSFLMIVKQSHASADAADKKPLEDIYAYSGIAKTMPLTALGMMIILLSMTGIPPFAGFFAKFYLFKAILGAGNYNLAILAAISAVIATYYYLKIIKIMFFDELNETYNKKPTLATTLIFIIMLLINSLYFIKPTIITEIIEQAVQTIL